MAGPEIVGLALAVPSFLETLIHTGQDLSVRISAARNPRLMTGDLSAFTTRSAQLLAQWTVGNQLCNSTRIDAAIQSALDRDFIDIQTRILEAKQYVAQVEKYGRLRRFWVADRPCKALEESTRGLERVIRQFEDTVKAVEASERLPANVFLSADVFQWVGNDVSEVSDRVCIRKGCLTRGYHKTKPKIGLFLRESRPYGSFSPARVQDIEDDIKFLSKNLTTAVEATGILDLVGYRNNLETEDFELIFDVKSDLKPKGVLRAFMASTEALSLSSRVEMCIQLADAVFQVHKLHLVHKNINSGNTIVMSDSRAADSALRIFLVNWRLVRKATNATTMQGETQWWRQIYQHPTRHLELAEVEYSMGHDIYSLGVCMIELLLWKPLVIQPSIDDPPVVSSIFISEAAKLGFEVDATPRDNCYPIKGRASTITKNTFFSVPRCLVIMAQDPPPSLNITITPKYEGRTPKSLDVHLLIEKPDLTVDMTLVSMTDVSELFPVPPYTSADAIHASDSEGDIPLVLENGDDGERHWEVTRKTTGNVTVTYSATHINNDSAPTVALLDLRRDHDGINGAGMSVFVLPPEDKTYTINFSWNLRESPDGTRAVWAYAERPGTVTKIGSTKLVSESHFAVGPSLHSHPSTVDEDFGFYWFGQPDFEVLQLTEWTQTLFRYMRRFFRDAEPTYRIFMRGSASSSGTGAAALLRSFMFSYAMGANNTWEGFQTLVSHEMVHTWPTLSGDDDVTWLDAKIRERSNGTRSIDDAVLKLLDRTRLGQGDSLEDLLDVLEGELESARDEYERMADAKLVVPPDNSLSPYLTVQKTELEQYEVGFEKEVKDGRSFISKVMLDSRAAQAGLMAGDEIVSTEDRLSNPDILVAYEDVNAETRVKYDNKQRNTNHSPGASGALLPMFALILMRLSPYFLGLYT
ncbi:hypothetical protein CEP51_005322 [Fusarium floridanum]|uniref:Protein kinase domain-containing protein n=1 Tax=Fusarium floridanum TaxID=1325733 RepID=A0A428RXJ9_9HYPO|nr:hypothetical protein CEP51_005322 [Fusarium floridanum]